MVGVPEKANEINLPFAESGVTEDESVAVAMGGTKQRGWVKYGGAVVPGTGTEEKTHKAAGSALLQLSELTGQLTLLVRDFGGVGHSGGMLVK